MQTRNAMYVRRYAAQGLPFQCLAVIIVAVLIGGSLAAVDPSPGAVQAGSGSSIAAPAKVLPESASKPASASSGPSPMATPEPNSWPMAGANPQRTSWSPEQVPSAAYLAAHRQTIANGMLYLQWAKPIEPFISSKVQVIAANNMLYISTARGLYALDAGTGAQKWVYATELPLGNAPTLYGNTAYVGGLDKKIHAIDALTGQALWTFEATQGFETNPLIVNDILYAGNRDGYLYAINVNTHLLAWKYQTGGAILFSAAYTVTAAHPGGVVYFASNDNYAYALDAQTGALVWKSVNLPTAGFQAWWPVVYGNRVIFVGASIYRDVVQPGPGVNIDSLDRQDVFPGADTALKGTPVGARTGAQIDASAITNYFQAKPWRRTYFILNQDTGQEVTPYAPILWFGTQSGMRYPPLVGSDGNLYQANDFLASPSINGGGVSGWISGTSRILAPLANWLAIDEPIAYAAGGNIIYWTLTGNAAAGGVDISVPNTRFWSGGNPPLADGTREWVYWSYDLQTRLPGYDVAYGGTEEFGGINGVYDRSEENAPIPYRGKVYLIQGNAVMALGPTSVQASVLAMAPSPALTQTPGVVDRSVLKQNLAAEVQKIVAAGHLRPGFMNSGLANIQMVQNCSDYLQDYWHDPSDTLYALLRALPYLPADLQQSTKTYLQSEFTNYAPYVYTHVGWKDGAAREAYALPPEVDAARANFPKNPASSWNFAGWGGGVYSGGTNYPPHMFYVLWKYAQVFGNASTIFNASKSKLSQEPGDAVLAKYPFVHNSYIAGYIGYLNLQKLAGQAEDATIRAKLNRLLALRVSTFSKDNTYYPQPTANSWSYCLVLSVSRNFLFLVPELGDYLNANALSKVQQAVDEYSRIEPYWFVAAYEDTMGEGKNQPLYDVNALFQARALILKEPVTTLVNYLDVPAFQVGDLFYIDNLDTLLEAQNIDITASRSSARRGDVVQYTLTIGSPLLPTQPITVTNTWSAGLQYDGNLCSASAGTPVCADRSVSWSGAMPSTTPLVITYTTRVTATAAGPLVNQLQVDGGSQGVYSRTVTIQANAVQVYLPQVAKGQ